ncbi:MAG: DUF898 family protein [Ancalomicrobiaceae bacterium]|nr:DUF898 family protein [Ancalomicrobiaceae bacterium]
MPAVLSVERAYFDIDTPGVVAMAIWGSLLSFLTLGIYRFWFTVNVRRDLWRRAMFAGSSFEYTGTVWEIFKGFLVALIILAPIWALYTLGTALLPSRQYGEVAGLMTFVAVIAFLFFIYFATYRARRYRVSRTLWRGVRFHQTGSGVAYALMNFGWWLLVPFSCGVSIPFARASLERYRMNNTWFGDKRFQSQASGSAMMPGFLSYLGLVLGPSLLLALLGGVALAMGVGVQHVGEIFDELSRMTKIGSTVGDRHAAGIVFGFGFLILAAIWLCLAPFVCWPIYCAWEWRSFTERMSVGGVKFRSDFSAWEFYTTYLVFLAIMTGLLMAVSMVSGVVIGLAYLAHAKDNSFLPIIVVGPLYLLVLWGLSVARLKVFLFGLTGKLIRTTTVIGLELLGDTLSRRDKVGALGDDFSGGFDIGAI